MSHAQNLPARDSVFTERGHRDNFAHPIPKNYSLAFHFFTSFFKYMCLCSISRIWRYLILIKRARVDWAFTMCKSLRISALHSLTHSVLTKSRRWKILLYFYALGIGKLRLGKIGSQALPDPKAHVQKHQKLHLTFPVRSMIVGVALVFRPLSLIPPHQSFFISEAVMFTWKITRQNFL